MGFVDVAASYLFFTVIHTCLFALSLTACGLYGTDLQRANEANKYADSKWVYAVVVGAMSAVTCVLYFIPFVLRLIGVVAAIWDFILFVLWIAVFGVFGKVCYWALACAIKFEPACLTAGRCTSTKIPRATAAFVA
jgi:hypothetical protein